ncbi:MAG: threonylcarbamoyl-AMP synthase [Candidatus Omnitrophica bacterium]|nr:threonylcarbamoyl-AMP synthase [Candidatus Omnitrophota bacterium]
MKTKILKIDPLAPETELVLEAARCVHKGGLVIFPTETVYGIAADNANPVAMKRLREVKKRSDDKPFSVMVAQKELIRNYTTYADPKLYKLVDRYWPGPLTVIVPAAGETPGQTIGIRIPDHLVALKLVENARCTIAAPSANVEGNPPPTTCAEALRDLDGLVDLAIDSGKVDIGTASTIVDFTKAKPTVVREGVISQEDVNTVVGCKNILFICTGNSCRSVMAEYLFRKRIKGRKDVDVSSCGTSVLFPTSASQEALGVLKSYGMDAREHLSRPLTNMLLKKSDLIFVMTRLHRSQVLERVPSVEPRVYLLGEFRSAPVRRESDLDIPDPIGHARAEYQACAAFIDDCLGKVINLI